MTVTKLRVSRRQLLARIREAAKSSSNVIFVPPLEKRSIAGMMTFHQAFSCLQEGTVVGNPVLNDRGDWELMMERYAANFLFKLKVIAMCDGAHISKLVVFPSGAEYV